MTDQPGVTIARVYDEPGNGGRARLLVDRVWPRGVAKADLAHDAWIRDAAPSSELRKWFGHDPERWDGFVKHYRAELDEKPEAVERCLKWCRQGPVTLLYAAKDRKHNNAIVLRDYLLEHLDGPSKTNGHSE